MQRGGALIDGLEALDEALPRAARLGADGLELLAERACARCCASSSRRVGGALLAGAGGVVAGGRGGLAGGGGDLTGAERLGLGAVRLALGDLELAAEAGDQVAQLLGVRAAALLRALGERDGLVDRRAQRADVGEHGAGAAIDRGDPLERRPRRPRAPAGRSPTSSRESRRSRSRGDLLAEPARAVVAGGERLEPRRQLHDLVVVGERREVARG